MRLAVLSTFAISFSAAVAEAERRDQHANVLENIKGSIEVEGEDIRLDSGARGRDSYGYVAGECYDEALNPVIFSSSSGDKAWVQVQQNETNWTGENEGQNLMNTTFSHTNSYFDIYDAYFNGSLSLKFEPPADANCSVVETQAQPFSYLRIGQMSRNNSIYRRDKYDGNPYYLRIGRFTERDYDCQFTSRKSFASLESSNDGFEHNQVWTLNATQHDGKYTISGEIKSTYANMNNYYNTLPFASSGNNVDPGCPSHHYEATLTARNNVTMIGILSSTVAVVNWYFIDLDTNFKVTASFNGTAWSGGASLDTTSEEAFPVLTGQAKRIGDFDFDDKDGDADDEKGNSNDDDSDDADSEETYVEEHKTGIIAGTVIGGIAVLSILGAGAFFFWQWWRKRNYHEAKQVDLDDAWNLDDHREEPEYKDGVMSTLQPLPTQQTVDTSYNAHRSMSADLGTPGLPAYSDHYTPLK